MELRILETGALEITRAFHCFSVEEEGFGWHEGKAFLTARELEELVMKLPDLLAESRAVRLTERGRKIREKEEEIRKLREGR